MANVAQYGFRLVQAPTMGGKMAPISYPVASGLQCVANAVNVDFCVGDPCVLLSTGYVGPGTGTGGTVFTVGDRCFGVIVGVEQYYDGTVIQKGLGNRVPGGTAYGTVYERETRVLVQPFVAGQIWEIDAVSAATYTTYAGWLAARGENVDLTFASANATLKKAFPLLDQTTHNTTATLAWRIVDIPQQTSAGPQDYASANVKVWVTPNLVQEAPFYTTGV